MASHELLDARDVSFCSSSSYSSAPTMISSVSQTHSSSGLDTPADSGQEDGDEDGGSFSHKRRLTLSKLNSKLSSDSFARPSRLIQALVDIDDASDSDMDVPFPSRRAAAKRKSTFPPSTGVRKATRRSRPVPFLVKGRSCSQPHSSDSSADEGSIVPKFKWPARRRPRSIDFTSLRPPTFHNNVGLGISGLPSPTIRQRAMSSPSLSGKAKSYAQLPPYSPLARNSLPRKSAVSHLSPVAERSFTPVHSPSYLPFLSPLSPPRERLLSAVDLPLLTPSPPMSPMSPRPGGRGHRHSLAVSSLSSRVVMDEGKRRLSLSPTPRRMKTPPIPPRLINSPRLEGLMPTSPSAVASPAVASPISSMPTLTHSTEHGLGLSSGVADPSTVYMSFSALGMPSLLAPEPVAHSYSHPRAVSSGTPPSPPLHLPQPPSPSPSSIAAAASLRETLACLHIAAAHNIHQARRGSGLSSPVGAGSSLPVLSGGADESPSSPSSAYSGLGRGAPPSFRMSWPRATPPASSSAAEADMYERRNSSPAPLGLGAGSQMQKAKPAPLRVVIPGAGVISSARPSIIVTPPATMPCAERASSTSAGSGVDTASNDDGTGSRSASHGAIRKLRDHDQRASFNPYFAHVAAHEEGRKADM